MRIRSAAALVTAAVATALALGTAACSAGGGSSPAAAGGGKALQLPEASAFKPGTCATIADPVLTLGHFTHDRAGAKLTAEDRARLVEQGEKLRLAKESPDAERPIADQIGNLLASIGYVRIRVGDTYRPELLADVETARTTLQTTCTS